MDKDDCALASHRCRFDADIEEELKSLKKSRQSYLNAGNVDSLVNSTRWDVASIKVRSSEDRPRSRETDLESRTTIACLKREIAEYKDQNAKLYELVREQKKKLEKCSADADGIDLTKERANITVTAIQKEYRSAQERVVELEGRNRTLIEEREKLETRVAKAEKRLYDFATQVLRAIGKNDVVKFDQVETVLEDLCTWFRDHTLLRGKHSSLTSEMKRMEEELNEHRSMVERLTQQSTSDIYKEKHESLLREFETHKLTKNELEKEVEHLKAKLETATSEIKSLSKALEDRSAAASKLEVERRRESTSAKTYETQYQAFKQTLAAMLCDAYATCPAREDDIKDRIRELQQMHKEKSELHDGVEERLKDLNRKFAEQYESHHSAEKKAREAEKEALKLREKLAAYERELGAGDVFRDNLKEERQKCQKLVTRIAKLLRIDRGRIETDGIDAVGDSIIRRIEKLVERGDDNDHERERCRHHSRSRSRTAEFEFSAEDDSHWKRKYEKAQEQLGAKEAHMEILRKKLAQLEERSFLNRLPDEAELSGVKKLEKRLRKAEEQLEEAKRDNASLKAELLECQNLRLQVYEQDKDIQALEKTMEKLEKVRQKQSVKITRLKSAIEGAGDDDKDDRSSSDEKIRTLKATLTESKRYERALREFRTVVARLVGLNTASSTVTDAEILSRLEQLLRARPGQDSLSIYPADLSPEFREGYKAVDGAITRQKHQNKHRSRSPSPHERLRSSSLSRAPRKKTAIKVDSRQY